MHSCRLITHGMREWVRCALDAPPGQALADRSTKGHATRARREEGNWRGVLTGERRRFRERVRSWDRRSQPDSGTLPRNAFGSRQRGDRELAHRDRAAEARPDRRGGLNQILALTRKPSRAETSPEWTWRAGSCSDW